MAVEKRSNKPDTILLVIIGILVFLGVLILASVSASFSQQKIGDTFYFLNHQLLFGLLPGLLLGVVAYFFPLELLRKWSFWLLLANVVLLSLVFIPGLGGDVSGASRWVSVGPISFQPSEFLKLSFIVYLASWLGAKTGRARSSHSSTFASFALVVGVISALLILQPDVGTLGLIGITAVMIYFVAPTPPWHALVMIGGGFAALAALIVLAPYRMSRLAVFIDPSLDPLGQGYQIKQALIGIGSGGLFGVGLGLSVQKFGFLPQPISDSIFAVFSEEMGFVGGFVLIALFLAFAWRALVIARRVPDVFSRLFAVGVASWISVQAFINIGSMVGVLPLTGIPLPFISYGGSALVAELIAMGLLLNISRQA